MKKVTISMIILIMFIFLVGCLDYKAYDIPTENEDLDLINEIAAIENELNIESESEDMMEDELNTGNESEESEEEVPSVIVMEEEIDLSEPVDDSAQVISVKENEMVHLKVKVSDPDKDTVSYTFSPPLNKQGEWKTNYGDAGEYMVTLTASDGQLTTEKKIKIVVERVNVPPIIDGIKNIIVNEGEKVTFEPMVTDPNNDAITVTISDPLKDNVFQTDHTSAGEYQITVLATDGELETEKNFKLTINDVNELPIVTNLADITVKEGETVKVEPKVSDLDEDEIVLTISDPVGDDGIWETGYTEHGDYVITVIADDGKDKVTHKVKVTVEDVNMPPVIVEVTLSIN